MSYIGKKNGNPNTDFLEAGGELENHDLVNVDSSGRIITPTVNRTSTDGDVITIAKDGTTVGSIASRSGESLQIGSTYGAESHICLSNGYVFPVTSSGGVRDDAINLGVSTARFKDLYLGGGVYVGGTTSANYLDDYEEGTFTPYLRDGTSGNALTASTTASYTKIGERVHCEIFFLNIDKTGTTTSNTLYITGFPFTANATGIGTCMTDRFNFNGWLVPLVVSSSTYAFIRNMVNGGYDTHTLVSDVVTNGGSDFYCSITYRTST